METIFVQIASYRDPECVSTLRDLFAKAKHPDRISVGICQQINEFEDKGFANEPLPRPKQVRTGIFHPRESKGAGWARMQAQSLWRGEDYVLQIHAHTRFEQDWDETLIAMLARCPSPRPVLSTCLPAYVPPDIYPHRERARSSFVMVQKFTPHEPQLLHLLGGLYNKNAPLQGPTRCPFWVGTFLFARADLMLKVPFDPHLFYYGENIAYSARLFTHGYDIFEPDQLVAYHWWGRVPSTPRPYRDPADERNRLGHMRTRHLLRFEAARKSAAIVELDQYGLGDARSLEDFWIFCGIHPASGVCTEFAQKGRWDEGYALLKENPPAAAKHPRIFVQIASYRDRECQWTIKDLFEKAKYPERIFVGVCGQYDPEEDKDCFQVSTRPEQVRTALFNWKESQGVCWARHQLQQLYKGEEYTLVIDSHMRFVFDWDERMINELAECPSPKAILTSYPPSYTPPHDLEEKARPTVQRAKPFSAEGNVQFKGEYLDRLPEKPLRGAFIAAGFMFSKASVIGEVPYDPLLYFNQEELSLTARFFTHGWDIYAPKDVLVYHHYNFPQEGVKKRPLHWSDNPEWSAFNARAQKRLAHLLGMEASSDKDVTRDLAKYGLGKARSLEEFEMFSGLDLKARVAGEKALRCGFIKDLARYMNKPIHIPEIDGKETTEYSLKGLAPLLSFPDPALSVRQPFDAMLLSNHDVRRLNVDKGAPEGVLVVYDYIERPICDALARYADAQAFTEMDVVDPLQSTKDKVVSVKHEGRVTHHVEIDGMAGEVLTIFNDIYCNRLAPFYNVNFEWYERPQILRYPPGGKYNQHADADHWVPEQDKWIRVQDRDYSVLLYLNDEFEGGELHFVEQNYKIKPRPGMLVAFPSDHKFLHAALPTTSGIRYVIVSWAGVVGSPRVRAQIPFASVFIRQKRTG